MDPARSREEVASLYRRHVAMVYQICLVLLKNVPDAEDASQNVFRKVMEYQKPFQSPDHERAWLITAARNECKNQLKHWWRTRRADESVLNTLTWEQPEDGALWELILSLPEKYRLPVHLFYYEGYSIKEAAAILGRREGTVRSQLTRARAMLRDRLEAERT